MKQYPNEDTLKEPIKIWLLYRDDIEGFYALEGKSTIYFGTNYKPNWFRRLMMHLLFGMRWYKRDAVPMEGP